MGPKPKPIEGRWYQVTGNSTAHSFPLGTYVMWNTNAGTGPATSRVPSGFHVFQFTDGNDQWWMYLADLRLVTLNIETSDDIERFVEA